MKKLLTATLFVGLLFVGFLPVFAGEQTVPGEKKDFGNYLPEEIPNIFDPEVRAQFQPVGVANLRGNPDFPVLILQNIVGGQPQTMLLGLDARNGKESWSSSLRSGHPDHPLRRSPDGFGGVDGRGVREVGETLPGFPEIG